MPETMVRRFSEIEIRITQCVVDKVPGKENLLQRLLEGKISEIKLFSVISDGVPDNTFHTELGVFPVPTDSQGVIKFGPYGYPLYRNRRGQIPRYLDCHLTVVEDNSDIRSMAALMSEVRRSNKFQELASLLLQAQINPAAVLGIDVAKEILNIGLSILKAKGDDILMQQYLYFNYAIDGYHGKFDLDADEVKATLEIVTA